MNHKATSGMIMTWEIAAVTSPLNIYVNKGLQNGHSLLETRIAPHHNDLRIKCRSWADSRSHPEYKHSPSLWTIQVNDLYEERGENQAKAQGSENSTQRSAGRAQDGTSPQGVSICSIWEFPVCESPACSQEVKEKPDQYSLHLQSGLSIRWNTLADV